MPNNIAEHKIKCNEQCGYQTGLHSISWQKNSQHSWTLCLHLTARVQRFEVKAPTTNDITANNVFAHLHNICSNVRQCKTSAKYTEVSGFKSRREDGRFWLVSFMFFFSPSKFRQRSDSWRWHYPAAAMLFTDSSRTPTLLPQAHAHCPKFPSHELYWSKLLIMVILPCLAEGWRISLMTR